MSVFVWIANLPSSHRRNVRYRDGSKNRRVVRIDEQAAPYGEDMPVQPYDRQAVLALAEVVPGFLYDHSRLLSLRQRAQYNFWVHTQNVDPSSLAFISVLRVCAIEAFPDKSRIEHLFNNYIVVWIDPKTSWPGFMPIGCPQLAHGTRSRCRQFSSRRFAKATSKA